MRFQLPLDASQQLLRLRCAGGQRDEVSRVRQRALPLALLCVEYGEGVGDARVARVGPAGLPLDDPAMTHVVAAFDGIGLRPYAPVHLRREALAGGGLALRWVRRTRIGGDSWAGEDVPLGEERELYRVRVLDASGGVLRTAEVAGPEWIYGPAERAADAGARFVEVAQVSALFGAGPNRRIEIDE